ncbi:RHS repeat-associated core domain-containing protein [Enterovibrio sp. Hal110]
MITDGYGVVVERRSYNVWGKQRKVIWQDDSPTHVEQAVITNRGYTGHEEIEEVGLIHMNGRVYDQELGRFISADPIVQAPFVTNSFNRYAYVWNNPLKYNDPTGYESGEPGQPDHDEGNWESQNDSWGSGGGSWGKNNDNGWGGEEDHLSTDGTENLDLGRGFGFEFGYAWRAIQEFFGVGPGNTAADEIEFRNRTAKTIARSRGIDAANRYLAGHQLSAKAVNYIRNQAIKGYENWVNGLDDGLIKEAFTNIMDYAKTYISTEINFNVLETHFFSASYTVALGFGYSGGKMIAIDSFGISTFDIEGGVGGLTVGVSVDVKNGVYHGPRQGLAGYGGGGTASATFFVGAAADVSFSGGSYLTASGPAAGIGPYGLYVEFGAHVSKATMNYSKDFHDQDIIYEF